MIEVLISSIAIGLLYSLVALSFNIIYLTNKFFDVAVAFVLTLCPFLVKELYLLGFSFWLSSLLSVITSIGIYAFLFYVIYQRLIILRIDSLKLLVVSLGLYIVFENLIAIKWGYDSKSFLIEGVKETFNLRGLIITYGQTITITLSVLFLLMYGILMNFTLIGTQIRANSQNPDLYRIFGNNPFRVRLYSIVFALSIGLLASILFSLEYNFNPTFGFSFLLYGIIAMIIGGVGSTWGIIGGSMLLSTSQYFTAYFLDSKWMNATAFILLIIFLFLRPYGFGGKKLRKVEV